MTHSGSELGELKKLLEKAATGDWTVWNPDASRSNDAVFHRGRTVCAPGGGGSLMAVAYCDYMTPEYAETHAALIAKLKSAAPRLIAAAEENKRLRNALNALTDSMNSWDGGVTWCASKEAFDRARALIARHPPPTPELITGEAGGE